jgi:hypothetical protein
MKKVNIYKYFAIILSAGLFGLASCNDPIYEFGFDGELSGKIVDAQGNLVSGDIKLATFAVQARGYRSEDDREDVDMILRIKNDGTYANTRLYPQYYDVRLVGPFYESPTAAVKVDLTGNKNVLKDFQVTPFLSIPPPTISGNPTSTQVVVNYNIIPNGDRAPNLREVYVSTISWPTRTTGSGGTYQTVTATVTANQGTATISGLKPNTNYFIRVGARAAGQNLFNHSTQISFRTPGN